MTIEKDILLLIRFLDLVLKTETLNSSDKIYITVIRNTLQKCINRDQVETIPEMKMKKEFICGSLLLLTKYKCCLESKYFDSLYNQYIENRTK